MRHNDRQSDNNFYFIIDLANQPWILATAAVKIIKHQLTYQFSQIMLFQNI